MLLFCFVFVGINLMCKPLSEMTYATAELIINGGVAAMWRTRLQATASGASHLPMCQFERQ